MTERPAPLSSWRVCATPPLRGRIRSAPMLNAGPSSDRRAGGGSCQSRTRTTSAPPTKARGRAQGAAAPPHAAVLRVRRPRCRCSLRSSAEGILLRRLEVRGIREVKKIERRNVGHFLAPGRTCRLHATPYEFDEVLGAVIGTECLDVSDGLRRPPRRSPARTSLRTRSQRNHHVKSRAAVGRRRAARGPPCSLA